MEDKKFLTLEFKDFNNDVANIIADTRDNKVKNADEVKEFAEILQSLRESTNNIRNDLKSQREGKWINIRKNEEIGKEIEEITKRVDSNKLSDPYKEVCKKLLSNIEDISKEINRPNKYTENTEKLNKCDLDLGKALHALKVVNNKSGSADCFKEEYKKITDQLDSTKSDKSGTYKEQIKSFFNYLGRNGREAGEDPHFNEVHNKLQITLERLLTLSQLSNESVDFIDKLRSEFASLQNNGSDNDFRNNVLYFIDQVDEKYKEMSKDIGEKKLNEFERKSQKFLKNYSDQIESNGNMESNLFYLRLFMIFMAMATPLGPLQAIFGLVDFINFFEILNNIVGVILPSDATSFGQGLGDAAQVPGISHIVEFGANNIPIIKDVGEIIHFITDSPLFELLAAPVEMIRDELGTLFALTLILFEAGNEADISSKKGYNKDLGEKTVEDIIDGADNLEKNLYDKEREKFIEDIDKLTLKLNTDQLQRLYGMVQKTDPDTRTSSKKLTDDEYRKEIKDSIIKKAFGKMGLKPHIPDTSIKGAQSKQLLQSKIPTLTTQVA
jgi:hypothetical protein